MWSLFMALIRAARETDAGRPDDRGPALSEVMEAEESFLDAEALFLRLGLPREFAA